MKKLFLLNVLRVFIFIVSYFTLFFLIFSIIVPYPYNRRARKYFVLNLIVLLTYLCGHLYFIDFFSVVIVVVLFIPNWDKVLDPFPKHLILFFIYLFIYFLGFIVFIDRYRFLVAIIFLSLFDIWNYNAIDF